MTILSSKVYLCLHVLLKKTNPRINIKRKFKCWKVMFFGSDDFSVVNLKELVKCLEKNTIQKLEVVSLSNKSPVSEYALSNSLKLHIWPPVLAEYFDIGVVVSFGKLIPERIIDHFPLGIINIHASLLPQYRGAMPISHAIKNGDSETGITVMKIKPHKFDTGDIIMQESCKIGSHELLPVLKKRLAILGAKCLSNTINNLPDSLERCVPQSSSKVSLAPKLPKDVAIIQWDKMTAREIYNLYRALFGVYDLRTTWDSKQIKLICISVEHSKDYKLLNESRRLPPGSLEFCYKSRSLKVHCADKPLYICSIKMNQKMLLGHDFFYNYVKQLPMEERIFK